MTTRPNRLQYRGMTQAEIIRNMTDSEIAKGARKGAPAAIHEQNYRADAPALYKHTYELSGFETGLLIEAEITHAGGF